MSQETQEWVPLEGQDLLVALRTILADNPERHDQGIWVGNRFLPQDASGEVEFDEVPVEQLRPYMLAPVPAAPADPDAEFPACGTIGCVAGWGGILSAPSGSFITNGEIVLPGGRRYYLPSWVTPKMGITPRQAACIFSPSCSRERLIAMLDALIADPAADILTI